MTPESLPTIRHHSHFYRLVLFSQTIRHSETRVLTIMCGLCAELWPSHLWCVENACHNVTSITHSLDNNDRPGLNPYVVSQPSTWLRYRKIKLSDGKLLSNNKNLAGNSARGNIANIIEYQHYRELILCKKPKPLYIIMSFQTCPLPMYLWCAHSQSFTPCLSQGKH